MQKKPHIVIFNPDQWRGDVLGHMGNPAAVTPNIDCLVATDAVSFQSAFCQNPVCTPSRCSFMSGWYPHTAGHRTMRHMLHIDRDEPVLLKKLKEEGYFVWWGGKNDLVPGQDGSKDFCDVKFAPRPEDYIRWGRTPPVGEAKSQNWRGTPGDSTYYNFFFGKMEDDNICDHDWANVLGAIDFINSYDREEPLCIYLPLIYPHPVFRVEEPYFSLVDRSAVPNPFPATEAGMFEPEMRRGVRERMELSSMTKDEWRELRAVYYGMCARVDHQFGMVIEALQNANLYDDTAIFLLSDHGEYAGDYGLVEKTQNTFEDCLTRVPFIIKPPAGLAGKPGIRKAMVELVDFTATVYDISGIDAGYDHFGRSLLPLFERDPATFRDAVFCEGGRLDHENHASEQANNPSLDRESLYWPRQHAQVKGAPDHGKAAMCRTRTHKYIKRFYEPDQLFDLIEDPGESHDVIGDPAYADILQAMERRLLHWYMETCDTVPHEIDERSF